MATRRKNFRHNSSSIDDSCLKKQNLLHVCGYCTKLVGNDKKIQREHVNSHKDEITQCRSCCLFLNIKEKKSHLKIVHPCNYKRIEFFVDNSLIELRIAAGKSFSCFWGVCLTSKDSTLNHFSSYLPRWWSNYKNGRSIGVFRVLKSKFFWKCAICDGEPSKTFYETISMRAYALSHLEQNHYEDIMMNEPGLLEFEWFHLAEEAHFDIRALMHIRKQRLKIKERSYLTFYSINLSGLKNGEDFLSKLKSRSSMEIDEVRYCLVCCCLVPVNMICNHFHSSSHNHLKAVAASTSFSMAPDMLQVEQPDNQFIKEKNENDELSTFAFPEELFRYSKVYKNLRNDEFKWRCCLCPHSRAHMFPTLIILRMYALKHIEENHNFLFTEEFLSYEWLSVKHEMRASFDIRRYTPMLYTLKGESTFNETDPNDYILPQQYFFLPKEYVDNTIICGFCYQPVNRNDFTRHIVIHGFCGTTGLSCDLQQVVFNETVTQLMGQSSYSRKGLDDEPHKILSVIGDRLKLKMDESNKRAFESGLSETTTPTRSERDTDVESCIPRRKTAMDARFILSETFRILRDNARRRHEGFDESSCSPSSSSDESNSEDERFEKSLMLGSTKKTKRQRRSESGERKVISKMTPAEIRDWIREEARKKGVSWKDSSSSSSEENSDSDANVTVKTGNKWDTMNLKEIKKHVRAAAMKRNIEITGSSSSSDSE